MTHRQKQENESFFSRIATMTSIYMWPEKGHLYEIDNGAFITSNQQAFDDLRLITPASFHNRIILR